MDNISTDSLSDEEQQLIDINPSNDKRLKNKRCKACLCLLIILIIEFIILYFTWDFNNEDIGEGIGATMGHARRRRSCDDEEYGCCNIYSNCKINNVHIDYDKTELSLYRIVARDSIHSNCPSFQHLIDLYNQHYGNVTTDCGKYGCCSGFNVGCDETIRETMIHGNNQNMFDTLHKNSKIVNIQIPKKNSLGSNCGNKFYRLYDIIHSYEMNYPSKDSYDGIYIIVAVLLLFMCFATSK